MFEHGIRHIQYKYKVIRDGVTLKELHAVGDSHPSISMVSTGEIKSSFRGIFAVPREVDFLSDTLGVSMVSDGVEIPLGEFIITTITEHYARGTLHQELEGYDKGVRVKSATLDSPLYLAAGESYLDAVQGQLLACGIENAIADPCGAVLQTDREDWEIGESRMTVINTLLSEINYRPLWFDSGGSARLTRYTDPSGDNTAHTYRADAMSVIGEETDRSRDIYQIYNDFIVIVNNPDLEEPLIARATNDDPASVFAVSRIGRRTAPILRLNNFSGQEELQLYVDNLRKRSMLTTEGYTWTTANIPHEVYEVVVLDHPQLQGVVEETEWSMTLAAGAQMVHRGKKVQYL